MAENTSRSMNSEMMEGSTDGTWKKILPNRAGVSNNASRDRRQFSLWHYGVEEAPTMITPMGQRVTPYGKDAAPR